MVAESAAPSSAPAAPQPAQPYAPPDPRAEARRGLEEARDLLTSALDVLGGGGDPSKAAEVIGRSSDRVGSALHFLRQVMRA